ncbi:MAG: N-acetylmuramoyl-L-alanine amidase-like domain-containing protein [Syntrophales bacterium]
MIHLPEDREICDALLRSALERGDRTKPLPELIVEAGQYFLGAPYEPDTLESEGPEELVVDLRAFDCVTFVENAVVLAGLIAAGKTGFTDYLAALERIRYRRGRCDGYPSRLHYFTDWLYDNGRKGLVRDITREIGGVPFRKALHSLTDRREDHPALKDPGAFRRLRSIEGICSRRTHSYIPKADFAGREERITGGDIVAITTDETGIDVTHAGLAVRLGQELRLLHASSAEGKVILTEASLGSYLAARRSRTGIIVGRPVPPENAPNC